MKPGLFKKSAKIAVILGLSAVMLVLFSAGCAPPGKQQRIVPTMELSPTPDPEQGDLEDWLVFDDPELACSFNYPISTTIETGKSPRGIYTIRLQFQLHGVGGYQGMVIQVVPISDSSELDAVLKQVYESSSQTLSLDEWLEELEPTLVGEIPGYRTTCSQEATDFSIVIPQENRVFVVTPSHDMAVTCADPQALNVFYRILETLIIRQDSAE